jgi:hypothetical protein
MASWKDDSEPVQFPARRARCPQCGKVGLRSVVVVRRVPRCWKYAHERKPSFMPGVFQAVECLVPFTEDNMPKGLAKLKGEA